MKTNVHILFAIAGIAAFAQLALCESKYVPPPWFNDCQDETPCCNADSDPFAKDRVSAEFDGAVFFCPIEHLGPKHIPRFDFAPIDLRLGYMLNSPNPEKPLCGGTFEALLEMTTAPVLTGPGNIVVGPSALLRYNFCAEPNSKVVPYLQAGAGIVYNNGYRDNTQNALGEAVEFYLSAAFGLHFMLSNSWSLNVEAGYEHISNGGLADRNAGINALGGSLGLTYYFPGSCR